jgi:hypothetical protein
MSYLNDAGEPPVAAGASGPIFDLVCAPGRCAPFADNQCRTVLRRATLDAIALANNAADKLHQLFGFVGDISDVSRRVNAHCYEAFAMRLAGHAADPSDVAQCRP